MPVEVTGVWVEHPCTKCGRYDVDHSVPPGHNTRRCACSIICYECHEEVAREARRLNAVMLAHVESCATCQAHLKETE